jgi:hypothetical protein
MLKNVLEGLTPMRLVNTFARIAQKATFAIALQFILFFALLDITVL